jgi:uncharacterized protein (TIGR03435 family)
MLVQLVMLAVVDLAPSQILAADPHPEFEVASIKPSAAADDRTLVYLLPEGGLRASGAILKYLLGLAYGVRPSQISGGGRWIDSDRFDVLATVVRSAGLENTSSEQRQVTEAQIKTMGDLMRPRLQALLADRFQLRLHRGTKEESGHVLVPGRGGTKLEPSTESRGIRIARGQLSANGATLEMLASVLTSLLGRAVADRTKVKGTFKFKLEWPPDDSPTAVDLNAPSIFTALQQQLGLRLETTKSAIEVLIIDHVERPSPN